MDASEAVELEASALARTCKQVEIVRVNPAGYLDEVLCELGRHGVGELLVEPGPTLFGGLWDACAIDRIVTVTRGDIAGASAPSLHPSAVDIQRSALATRFAPLETGIVGDVAVVQWTSEPLQATRAHPSAGYDAATEVGVT